MSAEVVEGPDRLYVITGDPDLGYDVRPVGDPIATYQHKYIARRDVRSGEVNAAKEESSEDR